MRNTVKLNITPKINYFYFVIQLMAFIVVSDVTFCFITLCCRDGFKKSFNTGKENLKF